MFDFLRRRKSGKSEKQLELDNMIASKVSSIYKELIRELAENDEASQNISAQQEEIITARLSLRNAGRRLVPWEEVGEGLRDGPIRGVAAERQYNQAMNYLPDDLIRNFKWLENTI